MVAAQFDRTSFNCDACTKAYAVSEERGRAQKESNSGTPGECDGPREWVWFRGHPSGGIRWTGCPRRSTTPRFDAWISLYDRIDGKLTLSEARSLPMLLGEAFDALDFVRSLQAWDSRQRAQEEPPIRFAGRSS